MQAFTDQRDESTPDELWVLQHHSVFTQGQAGKAEHLLDAANIPVVQSDRGGQITYHGPGQLVIYLLLDLKRLKLGVRALVTLIENTLVDLLAQYSIAAKPRPDAPGVYLDNEQGAKIAQLGLRVRRGRSFHGLSLNVDMDLSPFTQINPCGLTDTPVTSMAEVLGQPINIDHVADALVEKLSAELGYTSGK